MERRPGQMLLPAYWTRIGMWNRGCRYDMESRDMCMLHARCRCGDLQGAT